jgi:hypothetical protein
MKNISHALCILLFAFFLTPTHLLFGQGEFISIATGGWSSTASWTLVSGSDSDGIPDANDNVTIGAHTIYLSQTQACYNLTTPGGSTTRLSCDVNYLEINNKLTFSSPPTDEYYITSTNETSGIKFVGAGSSARDPLITSGAAFGNGYSMTVACTGTSTLHTGATTLKFDNLTVSDGILNIGGEVYIRTGFKVEPSGTVITVGSIGRTSSIPNTACLTAKIEGTLETSSPNLHAFNITINGTIRIKSTTALSSNPGTSEWVYGTNAILEYAANGEAKMGAEVDRTSAPNPIIPKMKLNRPTAGNAVSTNFTNPRIRVLEFTNGKLLCSGNAIIVANGDIIGESLTSYALTQGTGLALVREGVGITPVEFPIGTTTAYLPITAFSNSGTIDAFAAHVTPFTPFCVISPSSGAVTATWNISETISGGSNCAMTIDFTNASITGTLNGTAKIGHCTGTVTDYSNGSVSGTIASGAGFTNFSPFAIANATALPVSWTAFTCIAQENTTELTFTTASQHDNAYFDIERSTDGQGFRNIGQVQGAGNSNEEITYSFTDESPTKGLNYYRLKQVGFDGAFDYSKVITVYFGRNSSLSILPTLVVDQISIRIDQKSTEQPGIWEIIDLCGHQVLAGVFPSEQGVFQIDLSALQSSAYLIRVQVGNQIMTERVMKF